MLRRISSWALVAFLSGLGTLGPPLGLETIRAQERPGELSAASWAENSLRPGDAVRLFFSREVELSGEFEVDGRGSLVLPVLGRVTVHDSSAEELKAELEGRYDEHLRNQSVQVTPLRRVRVLGAVHRPGLYLADATMSITDVLALAGGVTDRGHPTDIRVLRAGEELLVSMEPGVPDLGVRSGDQLLVPDRSWFSRNSALLAGAFISAVGFIVGQAIF
jgi:protein involved in polysaccharide export with SLBB domain